MGEDVGGREGGKGGEREGWREGEREKGGLEKRGWRREVGEERLRIGWDGRLDGMGWDDI